MSTVSLAAPLCSQASVTNIWNGPGAGWNNWSSAANWSLGRVPGPAGDYVRFTDAGASATPSTINNVVDGGFTGNIAGLYYGNTNASHTTLIAAGQTLSVGGDLIVGVVGGSARADTITGGGGALVVNGGSVASIAVGDIASNSAPPGVTLDMSGLDNFTASVGSFLVGTSPTNYRGSGKLVLARTNTIIASGPTFALIIGQGETNSPVLGSSGTLILGQTNNIFADSACVGYGLSSSLMTFNSSFSGSVARFRGQDGASRMSTFVIAHGPAGFFGNSATVDFSSGTVDLQADTLAVSRMGTNAVASFSNVPSYGTLSFSGGTIDANTLQIGVNLWTNDSYSVGTLNVQGTAKVVVNTALELGRCVAGYSSSLNKGVVNIAGGTAMASVINANYLSTDNTITMANGALIVSNTAGPGINTFSMSNSVFQLPARATPSAIVTNLVTGGTTNIINIGSVSGLSVFPTQTAVIKYSGAIGGGGFNFGLGTLPSGVPAYVGHLSNNAANSSVDLVLARFTLAAGLSNAQVNLTVTSDPGRAIDILASTNLMDWALLTTLTNTTGSIAFQDPPSNLSRRFYRARLIQ